MRVLILSDIHANIDALEAVEARALQEPGAVDEVWVLGDLVDYGGAPGEVIEWARAHATRVVRGNHDHAVGTGEDCRSAPAFRDLAVATRAYFRQRLPPADLAYLAGLPLQWATTVAGDRRAVLVHATPRDQLFEYVPANASEAAWHEALGHERAASFVFVGHSHDQFTRTIGGTVLINPGSVGLPKDGDPRAAFALFEDGRVELHRVAYDTARAAARLTAVPLDDNQRRRLTHLICHAQLP